MIKKIKLYDLLMTLLILSIFKVNFMTRIYPDFYKLLKIIVFLIVSIFIIEYVDISKKNYRNVFLFMISIFLSSLNGYFKNYINFSDFMIGIMQGLTIYYLFIMIDYGVKHDLEKNLIKITYNILVVYVLGTIIFLFKKDLNSIGGLKQYFVGNKFSTSYILLLFDIIYAIRYNVPLKNKFKFFLLIIVTIVICAYVECSTAVVASICLFLIFIKNIKIKNFLMKKNVLTFTFIFSFLILSVITIILGNKYVSFLVKDVLGENLTLTGRIQIYEKLPEIIEKEKVFGYGYSNEAVSEVVGYGNAQNAFYEILVSYGIVGALNLFILFRKAFNTKKVNYKYFPLYIFIYMILICGIVEISFNNLFYFVLFYVYAINQKDSDEMKIEGENYI